MVEDRRDAPDHLAVPVSEERFNSPVLSLERGVLREELPDATREWRYEVRIRAVQLLRQVLEHHLIRFRDAA